MSDVRDLLDDATSRPLAHPDPVGAVHARVRRRAVRTRAAVASGATLAVAAGAFAVITGPATPAVPPVSTSSPGTRYSTEWRHNWPALAPGEQGTAIAGEEPYQRTRELIVAHPEVFVGFRVTVGRPVVHDRYAFVLAADADPDAWSDEMAAAAGPGGFDVTRCLRPTADLDRAATEVRSARFPSGATIRKFDNLPGYEVRLEFPCTVLVELDVPRQPSLADAAYARDRWGDAVRLVGRSGRRD